MKTGKFIGGFLGAATVAYIICGCISLFLKGVWEINWAVFGVVLTWQTLTKFSEWTS